LTKFPIHIGSSGSTKRSLYVLNTTRKSGLETEENVYGQTRQIPHLPTSSLEQEKILLGFDLFCVYTLHCRNTLPVFEGSVGTTIIGDGRCFLM
jgi:hypothetical protein